MNDKDVKKSIVRKTVFLATAVIFLPATTDQKIFDQPLKKRG